ncbi:MAG TPA: sugar ABC transporter permease [Microlunatus sp.]
MTTTVRTLEATADLHRTSDGTAVRSNRPTDWRIRQGRFGYLLVAPAVLGLLLFQLGPLLWALTESMETFNPMTHRSNGFVGFSNFATVLGDPAFWQATRNTVLYGVVITAVEVPLALVIAVLLNAVVPGTRFARSAVIAALAVSESVAALLWFTILNQHTGLVNSFLGILGIDNIPWLVSPHLSMVSVMVVSIWKDLGLPVLIFLAGLQALDEDIYNAASLDGAGPFRQFIHLTVPLLRRSTMVATFMVVIAATRIFTPILIMTAGGPKGASSNLINYAYIQGFRNLDYGVGSAATVCLVLLLALATVIQGLAIRERD